MGMGISSIFVAHRTAVGAVTPSPIRRVALVPPYSNGQSQRMTRFDSLLFATAVALGMLASTGAARAEGDTAPICTKTEFEGGRFTVCTAQPAALQLHWRGADGQPYRSFGALADGLRAEGEMLRFAINAGMYDTDFRPIG